MTSLAFILINLKLIVQCSFGTFLYNPLHGISHVPTHPFYNYFFGKLGPNKNKSSKCVSFHNIGMILDKMLVTAT